MKPGLVLCGPDVVYGPLALLSGSFEEKIQKAARLGFCGVELMVRDPAQLDWLATKHALERAGLEVPQIVTGELFSADGLCLITADAEVYRQAEERIQSVIDLAAYLGAMVNIGRLRGRLSLLGEAAGRMDIATDRLFRVAEYAATRQVRITIEPLNRYETDFIYNTEEGILLIETLKCENLGLMLDIFHMNIEDVSIEESLLCAGELLWHVHIADSNRRYPGAGHIDFRGIFAALKKINYQGYVSAELLPLPDADMAAEKTIAFLRSNWN